MIASIIVGTKEDNDATFLNPHVPHALAATVIGKRADVEYIMRPQLAIDPSLPVASGPYGNNTSDDFSRQRRLE